MMYSKNRNLESENVRKKILKFLHSNVDEKIKSEPVRTEKDLNNIRDNEYIICPCLRGTRSWVIFCTFNEDYYAVNFDDRNIYPVAVNVAKEMYRGTIMEGIYFRSDDTSYLVIDEVYLLAGENQLLKPKDDRLNHLSRYITEYTMRNINYNMYVSQFYYTDKKNLFDLHERIKEDEKIQKITFYPKIFGRKIYNYTILDGDIVDHVVTITNYMMVKTGSPDVYNLLALNTKKKIGIAYIPDITCSKMCKGWFKKKTKLLVKFQSVGEKWMPIEIVEDDVAN